MYDSPVMADAVLVSSSHPHRPLCASSCKLFPELAQEKCLFCVFPSQYLSLTCASFLFYMPPFFLKQDFCLCGTDVRSQLTLIARLTGSCFIFRVVGKWQRV